jgi:hypothetical protein
MSEGGGTEGNGRADETGGAQGSQSSESGARAEKAQTSLTTAVRRRRGDQAFFLRLRDAIHQNHRALERLGT